MKKRALIIFFYISSIISIDNPHFYKASQFFYRPRLTEPGLFSIVGYSNWGGGDDGYNEERELVPLLSIWGCQNMQFIAKGVPQSILNKNPNSILNDLYEKDAECPFGQLCFSGKFRILSWDFDLQKNFCDGFFLHIHLPVRKLRIYNIKFQDLSTYENSGQVDFQQWRNFTFNFDEDINKYGLCFSRSVSNSGPGDLTFNLGKTINYEETTKIDFVDATLEAGILLPTGRSTDPSEPFDLPTGYNKHLGFPVAFSLSIGIFEWFTTGTYFNILLFKSNTQCIRMKTDLCQNGPIKLASGTANVKRGPLFTYGFYLEADHVTRGFTFLFGYQLNNQSKTEVTPFDNPTFDPFIVNSDSMLQGWQMSTINFLVEYDFADLEHPNRPKLGVTLDLTAKGKQIFRTKVGGFFFGADISCNF